MAFSQDMVAAVQAPADLAACRAALEAASSEVPATYAVWVKMRSAGHALYAADYLCLLRCAEDAVDKVGCIMHAPALCLASHRGSISECCACSDTFF